MSLKINRLLTLYNFTDHNDVSRIKYLVIHYVGATGGAEDNCRYYASQYVGASAHYYVGFNGEIWQSVPDEDIAWHCGAASYTHPDCRNSNSIGIELCVRNKGSKDATSRDWYFEDATIKQGIALVKELMQRYNIPASRIIRHYDVTGKICPNPYVYNHTKHTWDAFKAALSGNAPVQPTPTQRWYRVGTGWRDGDCTGQVGAYTSLKAAKKACPTGYRVYGPRGKVRYVPKALGADKYIPWVGKCTTDGVNVRTGPGTGYAQVADYPQIYSGNLVDVTGEQTTDRKWYHVRIGGSVTGYVAAEYIKKSPN